MIDQEAIAVADEPTALNTAEGAGSDPVSVLVANVGDETVYLGGEEVTVDDGIPLAAGDPPLAFNSLGVGEVVYGIVDTGTEEVRVLRLGVG